MTSTVRALIPAGHSKPIGRYSPGVSVDGLVFVSGQVATDADGAVLHPGDAAGQTEVVFERLRQVLAEAGGILADLVSVIVYVVDVKRDFQAVSGVRNRVLAEPGPASTLVEVSRLAEDGCLVEISGVAVVQG
ncbi:RidA family protein [Kutzneria buriramensis]|uniref:Enamine deaminase RidA (YjgF/YER057c/UK114 family) n=1 Tax=Kutzneria buriramensis TaxID=1045776 RepID=A0A3E0G8D0_9PSEU|nr:RidA family protein [Kutzneria buriramensis]REH18144.1 enamine deaminase RidA (YjgF/YER057c/UK114 family) [Kutzneria buriramensis]